jgi:transposase
VLVELSVVEQRYHAVMEVLAAGASKTDVADRSGVSRQSVHEWVRRYQADGLAGLADRSHRPKRHPAQMPPEVEAAVCELRRVHPRWGQRRLRHELGKNGCPGPVPSEASIYRLLVRRGLIEPKRRRRRREDYRRWERPGPMQLWQLDVMGGVFLTSGAELSARTVRHPRHSCFENEALAADSLKAWNVTPKVAAMRYRARGSAASSARGWRHAPGRKLTEVERRLVDAVRRGNLLDLSGGAEITEAEMRSWDQARTVRASVVRDIVLGRLTPDPDPHGLQLRGARVDGRLDLENVTASVSINLYYCLIGQGLIVRDARLPAVNLTGCRIEHATLPPLNADGLTVPAGVNLSRVVVAGDSPSGAVRLIAARIEGDLDCAGAVLRNKSGPALAADRLQVGLAVFLRDGFEAVGAGDVGAIRLGDARIGRLECTGVLRNESGPALDADGLQVDQDVFLRDGFQAVGTGEPGAVTMRDGRIGGVLDFTGAVLRNESGPALHGAGLHVNRVMDLRGGFEAVGAEDTDVVLDLADAHVGVLEMTPARWEHLQDPHRRMNVDGLTYTDLPQGSAGAKWLALIRDATPVYAPQPYQQLAAVHRAAGHDGAARRVLIQQRRDQLDRHALTGRTERAWAKITGVTLGFGYQPWRALLFLTAIVATSIALAVTVGGHGGLAARPTTPAGTLTAATPAGATTAVPCTTVDQIGVGLNLGLPLIKIANQDRCQPTATTAGQFVTIASWIMQALAWGFATLFIAGFTNAVRKT